MEVPFISSGALNRAHYALVRKVETAESTQAADQSLSVEIKSIRQHLTNSTVSTKQCREHLIVLLYCYMTITPGFLPHDAFDFALPHAVSLAEAGQGIEQKRTGYLFCAEVMPPNHELQLMLVNTLRKDLESMSISRICLALDNAIVSCNEDLIPAIQSRLHDLLSHTSYHVRRRALLAFRAFSRNNPDILKQIRRKVVKRLGDTNQAVVSSALVVSGHMSGSIDSDYNVKREVNMLLKKMVLNAGGPEHWVLLRILHTLLSLSLFEENVPVVLDLVRSSSKSRDYAVLRGAFLLLSTIAPQILLSVGKSGHKPPVQHIRHLLTSYDVNEHYIFLSCLECMDPVIWAGISPDTPAVLEGWEVERVMQLLDSADKLIRRKTLKVLSRVDPNIVAAYYSQALETVPPELSLKDRNEYATRLLEAVEMQSGEDGELYARELKVVIERLENYIPEDHSILEAAVETVLVYVRQSDISFRIGCATTLLTSAVELETPLGQTLMVVISALAVEVCGQLALPPADLLRGLASRLSGCIPSVQDACLLSMLRIAAECSEIPIEIIKSVTDLGQNSRRHTRQRCEQFVTLVDKKETLTAIVGNARSSSLPDFMEALHRQAARPSQGRPTSPHSPIASSSRTLPTGKLRYKAYEKPPPAPKLRPRRASSSQHSFSSSRSDTFSDNGHDPYIRVSSRLSGSSVDPLSRTVTAGELALAAGGRELELIARAPSKLNTALSQKKPTADDLSARMDLIAFDSPFVSDPSEAQTEADEPDFENLWTSLEDSAGARGWCNTSIDGLVRRIQSLAPRRIQVISADVQPFLGDLKILILPDMNVPGSGTALVRLRESEEESCLWRLRSSDAQLRLQVKRLLTDD